MFYNWLRNGLGIINHIPIVLRRATKGTNKTSKLHPCSCARWFKTKFQLLPKNLDNHTYDPHLRPSALLRSILLGNHGTVSVLRYLLIDQQYQAQLIEVSQNSHDEIYQLVHLFELQLLSAGKAHCAETALFRHKVPFGRKIAILSQFYMLFSFHCRLPQLCAQPKTRLSQVSVPAIRMDNYCDSNVFVSFLAYLLQHLWRSHLFHHSFNANRYQWYICLPLRLFLWKASVDSAFTKENLVRIHWRSHKHLYLLYYCKSNAT